MEPSAQICACFFIRTKFIRTSTLRLSKKAKNNSRLQMLFVLKFDLCSYKKYQVLKRTLSLNKEFKCMKHFDPMSTEKTSKNATDPLIPPENASKMSIFSAKLRWYECLRTFTRT